MSDTDTTEPRKKPCARKEPEPVVAPPPWQPSPEDLTPPPLDLDAIRSAEVRWSTLKAMGRSPAHYLEGLLRPRERNRALDVGTIVHDMVLGGGPEVVVYPGAQRRGKAWDAFELEHAGKLIVTPSVYLTARRAADAVLADVEAMRLLDGEREVELPTWTHAGRKCGGRPDVIAPGRLTELKSTADASPWRFMRTAERLGYHGQHAWYGDGIELGGGGPIREHWIVVVEVSAPFVVQCIPVTEQTIEEGRRLYSSHLEQLRVCEESGVFPGYDRATWDLERDEELDWDEESEEAA